MRPPTHQRGPSFCIFLLSLLSSAFLFIGTYRYYSGLSLAPLFVVPDTRPLRHFSIELHPNDHIRRLPKSLSHHWNITKGVRAPDGVNKTVYLINGQFPGPTLEARTGDQLVIVVSNQLRDGEGVSFHWHGLHMRYANDMDGVVGVTQKEIPAGGEFTYRFEISETQSGTFWYHAHSELQRADGLYGGLVVHQRFVGGLSEGDIFNYDEEQLLLIGDWFHRPAVEVQASYLTSNSSADEPVPDSLLINGLGAFNCSMEIPTQPIECLDVRQPSMKLSPKATRLRVINVGSMSGFNFTMEQGDLQVIKLDGGNDVVPSGVVDRIGILYPGERMDIITRGGAKEVSVTLDPENLQSMDQAFTATQKFLINPTKKQGGPRDVGFLSVAKDSAFVKRGLDLSTVVGMDISESMPKAARQTVLVYTHVDTLAANHHVAIGYMNRTNWIPQAEPLIYLSREQWDEHQFMPEVKATKDWVDIVINNIDDRGYPFHLHGHNFYVLTRHAFSRTGNQKYNPFQPPPTSDQHLYPEPKLKNPVLKDTIHIPKRGYVVLRIRADNVGLWFFHCHGSWLQGAGMAMGLDIR